MRGSEGKGGCWKGMGGRVVEMKRRKIRLVENKEGESAKEEKEEKEVDGEEGGGE